MNLDRLRTFRVLSESLHVRQTAAKLHLSQSAVSQQISTLEEELGVMLLERIGRRVFLTPAGRVLAEEATRILAAVDRALESVRTYGTGETGRLCLGASTTPGIYLVPEVLGRLRAALPHVVVSLRIANSSEVERALVENELDLGVIGEDVTREELFQVAIGQDRIIAVAAPSVFGVARRARRSAPRRLGSTDLRSLPLLARETGSATRRYVDEGLASIGVSAAPAFEFPSPEAQVRGAAAGLGVAFVSQRVAADYLAAGKLLAVNIAGLRLVRPTGCASYLVGCAGKGVCAVIDPRVEEVDAYGAAAAAKSMRIASVIDTHVQADHRSGGRLLAERTGARYALHRDADVRFPFEPLIDGQLLELGNVTLRVLHTPGHTPESICLLVTDRRRGEEPWLVLTGDTLFSGAVGRPDLPGELETSASELHESLRRLMTLPDTVEVYPAHFSGSACGAGMNGKPMSTIGFERRWNPLLALGRDDFVRRVTEDILPKPAEMADVLRFNQGREA